MWIFEGILYVILLLVFIRYDRKKRLWIKTVSQEEKFEHYLSELSAAYGLCQSALYKMSEEK